MKNVSTSLISGHKSSIYIAVVQMRAFYPYFKVFTRLPLTVCISSSLLRLGPYNTASFLVHDSHGNRRREHKIESLHHLPRLPFKQCIILFKARPSLAYRPAKALHQAEQQNNGGSCALYFHARHNKWSLAAVLLSDVMSINL